MTKKKNRERSGSSFRIRKQKKKGAAYVQLEEQNEERVEVGGIKNGMLAVTSS